jgi:hypothetical protein
MPPYAPFLRRGERNRPKVLKARALLALGILAALSAAIQPRLHSQINQENQSQPMGPIDFGGRKDVPDRLAMRAMVKRLNADRQKQMAASTDRLLQLATDLKAETGRAESDPKDGPGSSAASAKKAEEIAKLAHTIRQKMAENYSNH